MNQRINKLAVQAGGIWQGGYVEQANGDSVYTDRKFVHGGDMDVEQFARLLVQECANVITETRWHLPPTQQQIAIGIKEHFGVEE